MAFVAFQASRGRLGMELRGGVILSSAKVRCRRELKTVREHSVLFLLFGKWNLPMFFAEDVKKQSTDVGILSDGAFFYSLQLDVDLSSDQYPKDPSGRREEKKGPDYSCVSFY
ncbi:hypothetical protein CEXT_292511 [Caerostris extrusa]|uniref:Uncharacterized protein n=1 Tax=Caerostris extrusa TaxID=172846 RepID=A0AAV4W8U2_CAEEX|nr:hypothetical protein CEXT_292511 [Caerostris extrusa]